MIKQVTDVNTSALQPPRGRANVLPALTRFDKRVLTVMVCLMGLTGLTILLGDRVGVTLVRMGPLGVARSTASIIVQFSETMNRQSVPPRLRVVQVPADKAGQDFQEGDVQAEVNGTFSWNASTLTFHPAAALKTGATYLVMLTAGATSDTGRQMLSEYHYSFTVRSPRVAYLYPADGVPYDIWAADPADPKSAKQLTRSPSGIYDYAVSPDGSKIAFSEKNTSTQTIDIKLLDLDTGQIQQITNCQKAECKSPVWRPDGQMIAYERNELNFNPAIPGQSTPTRIWVIDLSTTPPSTHPMFADSQVLGYGLQWSADGTRVSMYDSASEAIEVHNLLDNSTAQIPDSFGNTGVLAPDGLRIIFPMVVLSSTESRTYLELADLKTNTARSLANPTDPIDDDLPVWSPDGSSLVIARRYTDSRATRDKQLYQMNPADGSVQPLVIDPKYGNGFFSFDPTGEQLVIQRYPDPVAMNDPTNRGLPEIWTLDMASKTLTKVADDAFFGRWVP